ncbi:MAG TPA: hypothetical protein VMT54_07940 [Candidatus Cybelea sp.]|nr:hypothetical protein [Candidatus Cybelea sp.]
MAATLTASANPVGVWGAGDTSDTTISWSTGDAKVLARVYLTTAIGAVKSKETLFDGDPAKGSASGSKPLSVQLGYTYTLTLRQVSNNATLATLTVTVYDMRQIMIDNAAAAAALQNRLNPPQAIFGLVIVVGVDTARLSFNTVQPTIPIVICTVPDGTTAATSFPVLAGMKTEHTIVLGSNQPLAQLTRFGVSITAAGHNSRGKQMSAVVNSSFTTGSRTASISLNQVEMLQGSGDFTFNFGAGDADALTDLGEPWPVLQANFDENDPPHWIKESIAIPMAPRNLWICAVGVQGYFSLNMGLDQYGTRPGYGDGPLTGYVHDEHKNEAWATQVVNIAGGGTQVLDLMTGPHDIAFDVRGGVGATVTPGTAPGFKFHTVLGNSADAVAHFLEGGKKMMIVPPGAKRGLVLVRGADGAIHRRIAPGAKSRLGVDEGWVALTPATAGPVTIVATGEDRLACFTLDEKGAVLRADARGEHPARAWHALGGRFAGVVMAAVSGRAIELVAQDKEGAIFHRSVAAEGGSSAGEWQRIGEGKPGELACLSLGAHGTAVFALDRKGEVIHQHHQKGKWHGTWHAIPGATGDQLGVSWIEGEGVGLALVDAEERLHTLIWRRYPEGEPERWTAQGDLQAWLVQPEEQPAVAAEGPMAAVA